VTYYYLLSLPAVVVAIFLGRAVNQRMNGPSFLRYVHIGLIVVGAILLFQSIAEPFFGLFGRQTTHLRRESASERSRNRNHSGDQEMSLAAPRGQRYVTRLFVLVAG
jgi:hypothetical protein